jgi:hypothetical protein
MDSKELAKLVDFGTVHSFDSLLVARHGKVVAEAYYAPYSTSIPHVVNSCTKAVISTLTAIALKEGLLDNPSHRVMDFFRPSEHCKRRRSERSHNSSKPVGYDLRHRMDGTAR